MAKDRSAGQRLALHGLYPATVTPFQTDMTIDMTSLRTHLQRVSMTPGVNGVVVSGHAGEVLELTDDEQVAIVETARRIVPSEKMLICGLPARTFATAAGLGARLSSAGADALLVLPPFDVRPYRRLMSTPEACVPYFQTLAERAQIPLIVFQYPDTSGSAYSIDVLKELAQIDNVIAIKAATGSVTRYDQIWTHLNGSLSVLAASDAPELFGMLAIGSHGALIGISVIGTRHWVDAIKGIDSGITADTSRVFRQVCLPLMRGIFENQEPTAPIKSVAATKEALVQLGELSTSSVRQPGGQVTASVRDRVKAALSEAQITEA